MTTSTSRFSAFAVEPFPELQPGDDLAETITDVLAHTGIQLQDGDIVVVASKVVSITEKRYVAVLRGIAYSISEEGITAILHHQP